MGAETTSPPTSVGRGSDFVPTSIIAGSPAGIAEHLRTTHFAPGETRASIMEIGASGFPDPARAIGRLARFADAGVTKLAISDGTSWHLLVAGDAI
ncbi:hypothetical protein [Fulvimarina sp. MAC3]|uniref:hypothetical protein n=1 Tax=Fulvimarina sp. MAC3 TaxID=3148887 RepID=UPI0031FE3057